MADFQYLGNVNKPSGQASEASSSEDFRKLIEQLIGGAHCHAAARQPPLNRGARQMMRLPPRRTAASLSICLRPCSPKLTLRETTRASELLRLELCRVCVNCYSVERRFKPNPNAKSMMRMAASGQQVYIYITLKAHWFLCGVRG